jgi:tRNA-binding protein
MNTIVWNDFEKIELRVGRVVSARNFDQARKPAYVLEVDFGEEIGIKTSSAQITVHYRPEDLVGRLVVGVVNFPPKRIGPLESEVLITGFHDTNGDVVLCVPDDDVPLGARLA